MDVISGLDIKESKDVYSPSDDTYLLIELIEVDKNEDVLEIGCGTGIISLHCALNGAVVTAVDINEKAIELTRRNAEKNDVDFEDIHWSDIFSNVDGVWDVIIFNPPYLSHIPSLTYDSRWDGGVRGDEVILKFLDKAFLYLQPHGRIYFTCSDKSPLTRIYNSIEAGYSILEQKEKSFQFETIYAFAITLAGGDSPYLI